MRFVCIPFFVYYHLILLLIPSFFHSSVSTSPHLSCVALFSPSLYFTSAPMSASAPWRPPPLSAPCFPSSSLSQHPITLTPTLYFPRSSTFRFHWPYNLTILRVISNLPFLLYPKMGPARLLLPLLCRYLFPLYPIPSHPLPFAHPALPLPSPSPPSASVACVCDGGGGQ